MWKNTVDPDDRFDLLQSRTLSFWHSFFGGGLNEEDNHCIHTVLSDF